MDFRLEQWMVSVDSFTSEFLLVGRTPREIIELSADKQERRCHTSHFLSHRAQCFFLPTLPLASLLAYLTSLPEGPNALLSFQRLGLDATDPALKRAGRL